MPQNDWKAAARIVWMALTLVTGAAVLSPFVLSDRTIRQLTPVCERKQKYGRECVLCGTTTAFLAISRGEFREASRSNGFAIPLFIAFFANGAAAITYLLWRAGARRMR